ncbi:UbiA family prenyltransferase [Dictyobacter arantiisoli]|uniref:1,4-dihydroxy-2-naphthoate octaprenyltransferase n=1 Tax=Dictyobacter arantiisoli TaxID=2014874 RepID=A0A5A5TID9_9CHLR|nr:UbiA family prenyltransferase [Dictyobacter arantiisoli]GCF11167.1 hypothetical protein KDI_47310 [Dictyobacter arantiisoli]
MKNRKKRAAADILEGIFRLSHPGPVFLHGVAVTLFALLAGWPRLHWNTLLLVVAAHVVMQLAIAVSNDYCDRQLDALSKKNKPIVRGLISPREALLLAIFLMLLMVCLLLFINPLALLVSLLYLIIGQSYNLGLKGTPWSGIAFAIMFPLIPVYAFVAIGHMIPLILWQVPIAALSGIAVNLANSLPDIAEDAAGHARTLAVVLGHQGSVLACTCCILLAIVLIAVFALTGMVPAHLAILLPTLLLTTLAAGALYLYMRPRQSLQASKYYFYLLVLTCLLLAGGWIVSASQV